jgi:hypothetical protein
MSWWDIPVILYVVFVGVMNYRSEDVEGWVSWTIRTVLLGGLIAFPYFFWNTIASYWASSSEGPIDIDTGWW